MDRSREKNQRGSLLFITAKHVQRQVYRVVATPRGVLLMILCMFITLNSALFLFASGIGSSRSARRAIATLPRRNMLSAHGQRADERLHGFGSTAAPCHLSSDNLGGKPFLNRYCVGPIDVVYTWVNGSDPDWQRSKLECYD